MEVLWLVNYPLLRIAHKLNIKGSVNEGWLTGLSEELQKRPDIHLSICFPCDGQQIQGSVGTLNYYGYKRNMDVARYDKTLKDQFVDIIRKANPNVIHIMGSEFPHCLSMVEAAEDCEIQSRVLISIQGLVSIYADHYYTYLPPEVVCKGRTLRDYIKRTSLKKEREAYYQRGLYEKEAFRHVNYVMGRTEWDYACAKQMNHNIHYFHGGETLRHSFYENRWDMEKCKKHSVFISQATYPIKGFHVVLEAFRLVKEQYPDAKLYVSSACPYKDAAEKPKWRNSQYVNYVCELVAKYGLSENIEYLGALTEEPMCQAYLQSNVFVSASSIENSSNSLGEAMLLGVPCISSNVGGTKCMLKDGEEGILYPADEPYMLAHYIIKVFEEPELALAMSAKGHERAKKNHDKEKNILEIMDAYQYISERG